MYAIATERDVLYERINKRVDSMMEEGLLEEVVSLVDFRDLKSLQTVGYSELFQYIDNSYTLPFAIDKIKQHSRNYAKRQITWFKNQANVEWVRLENAMEIIQKKAI
jgi:tRNA dimethylallyltransferase